MEPAAADAEHRGPDGFRRERSIELLPASRLLGYAQTLCHWLSNVGRDDVLVVVFETGIWNEHRPLEQTIRDALPNAETIESRPALRSDAGDLDYLISYTFVCLTLGWGLSLVCQSGARWAVVDHDGMVWIGSAVEEEARNARAWLDR